MNPSYYSVSIPDDTEQILNISIIDDYDFMLHCKITFIDEQSINRFISTELYNQLQKIIRNRKLIEISNILENE